jgi:hypothetical protein
MTMIHRMSESQAKPDAYLQEFFSHLDEAPGVIRQSAKFFEFFAQTIYPLLEGLPQVWLQWWERYVESRVDPRAGVDTLKAHVIEAGHDMQGLLAWADRQSEPVRNHAQIPLIFIHKIHP